MQHDRWWIDKKLKDVERFEQRQLQIIGLVLIVITLLSPRLPPNTLGGQLFWVGVIISTVILIIIYLFLMWPRKAKFALGSSLQVKQLVNHYEAYIKELQGSLSRKAKAMILSYFILGTDFFCILGLIILG